MSIVDEYFKWLKSVTFFEQLDKDVARISLPFLNRNNDYAEIYIVKRSDSEYLLTDDGMTYSELELSGFEFTSKRLDILNTIVNSFGVSLDNSNAIYITADVSSLPMKKHMLIQCLTKVSDMFTLKNSSVKSLFIEDIAAFLDKNDIRYTPDISIIGKSKLPCQFDFAIPKSKNAPERLIKGINNLDNTTAKLLMFSWEDTRDNRSSESNLLAFINNVDKSIKSAALSSLKEYKITPIIWTERQSSLSRLTA